MLVVTPKVAIERTRDETLEGDIGEQERDEMMAFWRETKGLRPVKPFQWFPIKNEHNGVERDSNLKRTIFCATSGHTGTKLLTRILKTCSGVYSIHEPNKVENSLAGPYLGMANDYPMNKTVQNRSHKINLIRNGLKRGKVYAETSNMFIKTFYDLVLSQEDFDVDIVILRRSLPKVFRSHMIILGLYDFVGDLVAEQYINTTFSVNGAHTPAMPFPIDHATRVMRYIVDIEARTQRLYNQYKDSHKVHFVNSTLDEIINDPASIERMLTDMDLSYNKESVSKIISRNYNKKRVSSDMNLTVAKQMCFDYFARLQSKDLIVHPGLKALKTFKDSPTKVVSVVDLSLQCPSSGIAFGRFVNDLLQYSEHMIILGDPNSCPLYRAFILSCGSFATVLSTSDSGMETLADEVMKANATHVISVAPGEFLSKDFTNSSLLRQLVLSLEPGEALDVFSLDRKSYVPVAFALSNREQMIEPADRNVLTETGAKHYRMLTGTNLPGYPSYFVYKTKDF